MAFLSLWELFDIALMSLVVGFIFKDVFRPPVSLRDPDAFLKRAKNVTPGFHISKVSDFWFAVLLVAPAIVFHEFGHKFTAMAFGLTATFHAAYVWLGIGVLLKLVLPGFVFFIPAYVSYPDIATPLQSAAIAFAGPAINLLFWFSAWLFLKVKKKGVHKETIRFVAFFRYINGFLFIFNILPIPGFDGYHLFASLWIAFFG